MTPRKLWNELKGLSDYLKPMYFEDTDYSFKVKEAGYTNYFIPSSIVYHHEGLTSGTDLNSGFKRFQEVNRPKFKKKWSKSFQNHGKDGFNPDLEKDRGIMGRALFIDYTTPRPDVDAGGYAAIQEIKLVQSLGYKVTFLPKNLGDLGSYTQSLRDMGVEVITSPFYLSTEEFIAQRGSEFDCAYITRFYVAEESIPPLREHAVDCKIIMNNADLHFLRELRSAGEDEEKIEKAKDIREQELAMMLEADVVISYNDTEHAVIQSHTDNEVKVLKCPWVVQTPTLFPQFNKTNGLAFLGGFKHPPNQEGVEWFGSEILPFLDREKYQLSVYGSAMGHEAIASLKTLGINAVGYIENLENIYINHRIFIAPLLSGAGIKGKVINALAYGIPTILTPVAAEGIGLRHGYDCLIARNPDEWIESITTLYNNERLWKSISNASKQYAQQQFSFTKGRQQMRDIFESIELYRVKD
jgi:glycosyltransferase involved in cell wall biosynthesis